MKNQYRIIDYSYLGIPCIEVCGDQFYYQDLYEIVGRNQYMTTFEINNNSKSHEKFGSTILGVIYYDHKSLKELEHAFIKGIEVEKLRVRIDSPDRALSLQQKGDLKYQGIKISNIKQISFLPYKREVEKHETGEKKVPDIIELKVNCNGIDVDILNQNLLASKINTNTNLINYEKEQFIGITLAFNNGRIDSRILKHLGFDEQDLKNNLNIWSQLYQVKERRSQLNNIDKKNYREVKSILSLERATKTIKELTLSKLDDFNGLLEKKILKEIFESIENFSPAILLHGKNQVYWDIDSYIHIALRHVKDYQIGKYKYKTPFPYKAEDLKSLIEKVLYQVDGEIKQYLAQELKTDFTRHGKMGIFFNGDHYTLRINAEGRLIQFHPHA